MNQEIIMVEEEIQEQNCEEEKEIADGNNMIDCTTIPFCEANLGFVHDEVLYSLHPRMRVGETVYVEEAP